MCIACSPLKRKNNLRLSLNIVGCKRNQASVKLVNKMKNVNWLLLRNICEYMPNRQFPELPVRTPFISTMSLLGCGVFSQGFSCGFGVSCAHFPADTRTYIPVCSNHLFSAFPETTLCSAGSPKHLLHPEALAVPAYGPHPYSHATLLLTRHCYGVASIYMRRCYFVQKGKLLFIQPEHKLFHGVLFFLLLLAQTSVKLFTRMTEGIILRTQAGEEGKRWRGNCCSLQSFQ